MSVHKHQAHAFRFALFPEGPCGPDVFAATLGFPEGERKSVRESFGRAGERKWGELLSRRLLQVSSCTGAEKGNMKRPMILMCEQGSSAEVMPVFEWSNSLSVSVEQIDEQHKKLVEAINELNYKLHAGSSQIELKKTIEEIVYLASDNMRFEEEMMQKFRFPGFQEHLFRHAGVAAELLKLRWQSEQADFVVTREIPAALMNWLSSHIRKVDSRYSDCFIGNGMR
jgi:hemerythrin